jgi:transcriptional regulator GlxA family with amidase domain
MDKISTSKPFPEPSSTPVRKIATLIYPEANSIDVSGPLQVFSTANRLLQDRYQTKRKEFYKTIVIGPKPHPIKISAGLTLLPEYDLSHTPSDIHTLFIAGGTGAKTAASDENICEWIKVAYRKVERLASICTGAFILAATGLLENRKTTTHWEHTKELQEQHPNLKVEANAIFTQDGAIYCSAGVTAGIDLALSLVEEDWGNELALDVARQLIVFLKRPGGQSQFSQLLSIQTKTSSPITEVQHWALQNLSKNLSVEALATQAAMSPRHFSRVFQKESGLSPGKFIVRARLDMARNLLETTTLSLKQIGKQCGIGNTETLRRLFWQHFKTTPKNYRERFRSNNLN